MEGLYKKVIRGIYPKISSQYSPELHNIIKYMLLILPGQRPSCGKEYYFFIKIYKLINFLSKDKILASPYVMKHMDSSHFIQVDETNPEMLQTIRIPKNLHFLIEKLPKPNYHPMKIIKVDRKKFLNTIGGGIESSSDELKRSILPHINKSVKVLLFF